MADNLVEGLSVIKYKNREIIYANYSILNNDKEKVYALMKGLIAEYKKHPATRSTYSMVNVTNLHFDMDLLNRMKAGENDTNPYVKKVALFGVTGLLKVAYNFVIGITNSPYKIAKDEMDAKEWLVLD